MKQTVTNNAPRVYHFSFCVRGRITTVMIPPGSVSVKEDHLDELRKIDMFATLEKDGVLKVGDNVATIQAKAVKEPAKGKPTKSKAKSKKAETKPANMDLEDL